MFMSLLTHVLFKMSEKIIILIACSFLGVAWSQCLQLDQVGNKNYYIDSSLVNWYEANDFCRRHGMQLLTINNQQEYDNVIGYIRKNPTINGTTSDNSVWTSGTDYAKFGTWVWMSTGQIITYLRWSADSPDNSGGNQHCIVLWAPQNYQYNDDTFSSLRHFICEETTACSKPIQSSCCSRRCY